MGGFGPASAGSAQLCQIRPDQFFFQEFRFKLFD
jgi:hypothetical protein